MEATQFAYIKTLRLIKNVKLNQGKLFEIGATFDQNFFTGTKFYKYGGKKFQNCL